MTARAHSALHNLRMSNCKTPWDELRNDSERKSYCRDCKAAIIDIRGLDENEIEEFVHPWLGYTPGTKVLLRFDGTLLVELPSGSWKKWLAIGLSVQSIAAFAVGSLCFYTGQDHHQSFLVVWLLQFFFGFVFGILLLALALVMRVRTAIRFSTYIMVLPPIILAIPLNIAFRTVWALSSR